MLEGLGDFSVIGTVQGIPPACGNSPRPRKPQQEHQGDQRDAGASVREGRPVVRGGSSSPLTVAAESRNASLGELFPAYRGLRCCRSPPWLRRTRAARRRRKIPAPGAVAGQYLSSVPVLPPTPATPGISYGVPCHLYVAASRMGRSITSPLGVDLRVVGMWGHLLPATLKNPCRRRRRGARP